MKSSKDAELRKKFDVAYAEALTIFRSNPDQSWIALEDFKALPEPEPIPSKIPTQKEIVGWKDRFEKYKSMAATNRDDIEVRDHPKWDENKINVLHNNFDQNLYNTRREYLVNLDESIACTLSRSEQYDRIRFIRENMAHGGIKSFSQGVGSAPREKVSPAPYNRGGLVYAKWMGD
jgi:hypothetical protein